MFIAHRVDFATMREPLKKLAVCLLLCTAALPHPACTPRQYASQADRAAYASAESARKKAALEAASFTIQYRPFTPATPPASSQPVIVIGDKNITVGGGPPVALTLEESLEIAFRNSRAFQDAKEGLFLDALAVSSARHGWDYPFPGGDISADAKADKIGQGPDVNTGAVSAQPTLVQKLRQGGLLTLGYGVNLLTDFTGWNNTTVGSALTANFTQPLLRNAWNDFAYEPLYRMERNLLFAAYEYERFTQSFAADIVTRYYNVLRRRDVLTNDVANIERLKDTFALTRVQVEGGQVSQIEKDQAEQNLLDAQVRYEQNQQAYRSGLDQFKIAIGLPVRADIELDYPAALEKLSQAGPQKLPIEEAQAIEVAFQTRPDVLAAGASVRDAERNVQIAANQFLPQLDLQLGISAPGTPPRRFARTQFQRTERFAAVNFDYPIDQTSNRDAYRQSLIAQDKARRDLALFLDGVRLEVRESYRTLLVSRSSYDIQVHSLEIAKRRRKLAALQQKEGQASARDVLEAEQALLSAQNALAQALVDYTTTRLNFLGKLGMLSVDEKGQIHERTQSFEFNAVGRRYPYVQQP